jgi:hypothetical protein
VKFRSPPGTQCSSFTLNVSNKPVIHGHPQGLHKLFDLIEVLDIDVPEKRLDGGMNDIQDRVAHWISPHF